MDNSIQPPPLVNDSSKIGDNGQKSVASKNAFFGLISVVLKSIIIDAVVIVSIVAAAIVVLNYFNIVQISKVFPFLSFLPSSTQKVINKESVSNPSNATTENVPPVDRKEIFSNNNYGQSLKRLIDSGSVESVMLEISYNAVVDSPMLKSPVDTPQGKQDVWKMTVHANKEVRGLKFYREDLDNLQIFQLTNGKTQPITYKELQVGDSVTVRTKIDILRNANSDIVITRVNPSKEK